MEGHETLAKQKLVEFFNKLNENLLTTKVNEELASADGEQQKIDRIYS